MAVVGMAQEMPDSPQGSFDLNKHTVTRKFLVVTDNVNDGPLTVTSVSIGIPAIYSAYVFHGEFHLYCLLRKIDAERIEKGSLQWVVTCYYETGEPLTPEGNYSSGNRQENPGGNQNPLLEFPSISTRTERYDLPIYGVFDKITGEFKPCQASNGEVYTNPVPHRDASRVTMTISRNESLDSPVIATSVIYTDSVNADVFWDANPGCAKIMSINATKQTKQLPDGSIFAFLRVEYVIQFRPTWDLFILDSGTFYYEAFTNKKLRFITDDGHPLSEGPLNGMSNKLPDGDAPVFNQFRVYQRLPFATLNLPQTWTALA